jgi:hypothetical protein
MLTQATELAAGTMVLFLPGLVSLLALGIRERLLLAGLSAPVTAGLVLITAIVTGLTGVRFGLGSFAAVSALLCLLATGLRRLLPRRRTAGPRHRARLHQADRDRRAALSGRALLAARIAGAITALAGIAFATWTWKRGLGSWSTPAQEHDPVTHSVLLGYIEHTGDAAPWHLAPIDIVSGRPVVYYPSGFPALSALVAQVVGDPMTALNLVTVAALAIAWPLSVAALAAAVVRASGLGKGWTEFAAGIAALVAAFLYRPGFALAHDGGILPNAIAMALAPGLVAAMLVPGRCRWAAAVAIGIGTAGTISIHPSAAVTVGLTLLASWVGLLATRLGRARLAGSLAPLLLAGVVALPLVLPVLSGLTGLGGVGGTAWADTAPAPPGTALWNAVTLAYKGLFDPAGTLGQQVIGVLAATGALAALVFRRGWPLVTAYLFWVAVSVSYQLSPRSGFGATVGGFFYGVFTRLQSHVSLLVPALVAGLFVFAAAAVTGMRRAPGDRHARALLTVGVVLCALSVLTGTTLISYARTNIAALASRYVHPEFTRYDACDYAAVDWLHRHVRPGEVIMNSANDGSTLAYVDYGLTVQNVLPVGHKDLPESVELLRAFDTYPKDPAVRAIVRARNIRWVYADSRAPTIGIDPSGWYGRTTYSLAPGLAHLTGLPGLVPAYVSGHVTVYRLDLDTLSHLP